MTAIDDDRLTSDERGLIGCQKNYQTHEVFGELWPRYRPSGDDRVEYSRGIPGQSPLGLSASRRDRVDRDICLTNLPGEGAGEPNNSRLRSDIVEALIPAHIRGGRADVDDAPPASFIHPGEHPPGADKGATEVHGHHSVAQVHDDVVQSDVCKTDEESSVIQKDR